MRIILLLVSVLSCISVAQAQHVGQPTVSLHKIAFNETIEPNEGKVPLGTHEIPEKVLTAFQTSIFQHTEIIQVFLLQDEAVEEIIGSESADQPLQLYEFQLRSRARTFRQYFTPQGDLYDLSGSV